MGSTGVKYFLRVAGAAPGFKQQKKLLFRVLKDNLSDFFPFFSVGLVRL